MKVIKASTTTPIRSVSLVFASEHHRQLSRREGNKVLFTAPYSSDHFPVRQILLDQAAEGKE